MAGAARGPGREEVVNLHLSQAIKTFESGMAADILPAKNDSTSEAHSVGKKKYGGESSGGDNEKGRNTRKMDFPVA